MWQLTAIIGLSNKRMIKIVPIEEKYIEGFHAVLGVVALEKKYITFIEPPPFEGTKAFALDNIKQGNPHFVALSHETVVGWCDALGYSRVTMKHVYHFGMGLLPAFRHQGIGKRLLQTAMDDAIKKGGTRLELRVYEANLNAKRLYESLGFVTEGMERNSVKIDGVYLNSYVMAKIIT
jgi:ribosomal protein S18 acetylase RimI-like enzyme